MSSHARQGSKVGLLLMITCWSVLLRVLCVCLRSRGDSATSHAHAHTRTRTHTHHASLYHVMAMSSEIKSISCETMSNYYQIKYTNDSRVLRVQIYWIWICFPREWMCVEGFALNHSQDLQRGLPRPYILYTSHNKGCTDWDVPTLGVLINGYSTIFHCTK